MWRLFGFDIHDRYPAMVNLSVHLENGQRVYFTQENARQQVDDPTGTTLTAYFKLCDRDDFARTLLYADVPTYYKWERKMWVKRTQGKPVPD